MKTRKASEGEMPDSPAHPHHTTELLSGPASQERSQESSWQEVTIQPAFYCHPNSFPMFSVIPFLWVHFALVTIGLGPVCKERTREMVASRSFSGKSSPGHTWHTALLGMIFRPSAVCWCWLMTSVVIQGSHFCKVHTSQSFSCKYFWSRGAALFYENCCSK